ncbi:unnamed protein product [Effrenium voratum]|uniref:MIB/HERC2 domain-containing protein n=1 Tax=Effrenium voratum TaxID=2562239 RepID=A0AA36HY58_9DINO|nr:unnamed protein product [Effrenium voratum]
MACCSCYEVKRPEKLRISSRERTGSGEAKEEMPMKRPSNIGIAAKEKKADVPDTPKEKPKGDGGTGGTGGTNHVTAADSGGSAEKQELMPFKRQKTRDTSHALQRRKTAAMEDYLQALPEEAEAPSSGCLNPVTPQNVAVNLRVVRGPDWQWGEEDGGKSGVILSFDKAKSTAQVLWEGGKAQNHYRYGRHQDLLIQAGSSLGRRNSQAFFSSKSQTLLIFDWDDTLFPTTYVRDDLDLAWNRPLKDQDLTWAEKNEIGKKLEQCASHVVDLLKSAERFGKVVLVTLARAPWVSESCKNFFAPVGRLIQQLKVPIIYAQEGIQVDYNKEKMSSDEEIERFWSTVKGRAIARECSKFYSQYEGQSWKNVISIGDSDFERLGTQHAMEDYMRQTGIDGDGKLVEVNGHLYKVRTKTFKMVDEPTVEELTVEVSMLKAWLPLMVRLCSKRRMR